MRTILILGLAVALAGCAEQKSGDDIANGDNPSEADNTDKNERDRSGVSETPFDQKENASDLAISQAIREAVVDDDALSMDAKNVKIITADGVVTLRGPVSSIQEKSTIAATAKRTSGVKSVNDQLEVAAN